MLACTLDANVLYKGYSGKCCWSLYYVLVCDFMLTHYFFRYRYRNKTSFQWRWITFHIQFGWSFLAMLAASRLKGWLCHLVSLSTTLVQAEISQQLLDEIFFEHSWFPEEESDRLWWFPDFSSNATSRSKFSLIQWNISISNWWIGTTFCTDVLGPQMLNPSDFGYPEFHREVHICGLG